MVEFTGFPDDAFAFLRQLADNNEKRWFEANRARFEDGVKAPLTALLEDASREFGGAPKVMRIHRDVRFSPDKSPYKTNLAGLVRAATDAGDTSETSGGLYASVAADGLTCGTGYYEMSNDQLVRYRSALDDPAKASALEKAVAAARETLQVTGRALKTAPKGIARDHPAVELMRMKEILAMRTFPPPACNDSQLRHAVFAAWRDAAPIVHWLNRHVGPSELSPKERFARR